MTTGTRTTRRASSRTPRRSRASSSSATRTSAASSAASRSTTSRTRTATARARRCPTRPRNAWAAAPSSATPSCGAASSSGSHPGELRAGWQVINWGESTFIQGGINAVNPVDVSVLRVPGSELRDAMLPVGAVKLSIKPSSNTSLEGFYQYAWEETKIDPVGSYFSTTDLAGGGATKVMLGFGSVPDTVAVGHAPLPPSYSPVGHGRARRAADVEGPRRRSVRRGGARVVRRSGRHRTRRLLPELPQPPAADHGEDGHRRRACSRGNYAATAQYFLDLSRGHQALRRQLQHPARPHGHRAPGRGVAPPRRAAADRRRRTALRGALAAAPAGADAARRAAARAHRRRRARSWRARTRWAPSAGREKITGLSPLQHHAGADDRHAGVQPRSRRRPDRRSWPKAAGARSTTCPTRACCVSKRRARTRRGNEIHTTNKIQPGTEPASAFVDRPAPWGYVVAGALDYNNAIGAVTMMPRFSFSQDVTGISPGPGGNFLEGRKGLTVGLGSPVPVQLGARPELHQLLRRRPLQSAERSRLRRGQHQVLLLRHTVMRSTARFVATLSFGFDRRGRGLHPALGAGRRQARRRPDAARRREGRQRRRHDSRLGRRHHQGAGRLRARASTTSIRSRPTSRSSPSRSRTPASTPRSSPRATRRC